LYCNTAGGWTRGWRTRTYTLTGHGDMAWHRRQVLRTAALLVATTHLRTRPTPLTRDSPPFTSPSLPPDTVTFVPSLRIPIDYHTSSTLRACSPRTTCLRRYISSMPHQHFPSRFSPLLPAYLSQIFHTPYLCLQPSATAPCSCHFSCPLIPLPTHITHFSCWCFFFVVKAVFIWDR